MLQLTFNYCPDLVLCCFTVTVISQYMTSFIWIIVYILTASWINNRRHQHFSITSLILYVTTLQRLSPTSIHQLHFIYFINYIFPYSPNNSPRAFLSKVEKSVLVRFWPYFRVLFIWTNLHGKKNMLKNWCLMNISI